MNHSDLPRIPDKLSVDLSLVADSFLIPLKSRFVEIKEQKTWNGSTLLFRQTESLPPC